MHTPKSSANIFMNLKQMFSRKMPNQLTIYNKLVLSSGINETKAQTAINVNRIKTAQSLFLIDDTQNSKAFRATEQTAININRQETNFKSINDTMIERTSDVRDSDQRGASETVEVNVVYQ